MSRIDEIRERQRSRGFKGLAEAIHHESDDVEHLLSEVERLQTENGRLNDVVDDLRERIHNMRSWND